MIEYFKYIFSSQHSNGRKAYKFPNITRIICRIREHPYDVAWYNPGGLEPNTKCRNCGEDLG